MLFSAKEKPELFTKSITFVSVLNLILNYIIIKLMSAYSPEYAIFGAAIATAISWFAYFFIAVRLIKKDIKIAISFEPLLKSLISGIIMILSLLYLTRFVSDMDAFIGILMVLAGVIIYFAIIILIRGFDKRDIELIALTKRALIDKFVAN